MQKENTEKKKLHGRMRENGYWGIQMNEGYNKFISPDIESVSEVCRWEWFVHVVRVDGTSTGVKFTAG